MPEDKVLVIKLRNPRWDGWAVYRSWQECADAIRNLVEETWDEQDRYTGSSLEMHTLTDEYEIETDYMAETELDALEPLDY